MATIVLARHGETTWNVERRMQSWAPTPLTERGREQARALGAALRERYSFDRIVSSDLHRTTETTDLLLDVLDAPVTYERAWREHDIGIYQGLEIEEMFDRFPEFGLGEVGAEAADKKPERGESLNEARERVLNGWERLLDATAADETVLVLTHGGPVRMVLGDLKGLDIVETILGQSQGNCAINEFAYDCETGETRLVTENDTAHC